MPEVSEMLKQLLNDTAYTSRWSPDSESRLLELFKLERVATKNTKDMENVYKDRY